jgi:hypothetical protein
LLFFFYFHKFVIYFHIQYIYTLILFNYFQLINIKNINEHKHTNLLYKIHTFFFSSFSYVVIIMILKYDIQKKREREKKRLNHLIEEN